MGVYTSTSWVNGTTPLSQTNLNNLETQYADATLAFEQDLFAPFVLYGMVASKDLSTPNQLDVTAGVAFLLQTDATLARQAIASSSGPLTTSAHNTVYFLDLNPNGTYSFATSHSGTANYLTIAQATTDSSGNIVAVADSRTLSISMFPQMAGAVEFGTPGAAGAGVSFDAMGTAVGTGVLLPSSQTAVAVVGSGLGAGLYGYKVAYVSFSGQSALGSASTCTTTGTNGKVNISTIGTGPEGTLKRVIYRTKVGGSTYFLLTTLNDNTTTTYSDTTPDGSLVTSPPAHPTMGGDMWMSNSGTLLAAIYGDGAFMSDTGLIASNGNGTLAISSGFFQATSVNSASAAIQATLPSAPAGDQPVFRINVTGDATPRMNGYIRSSDGYAGWRAGAGGAITSHLYAQASGWQIDEAIVGLGGQTTAGSFGVPVVASYANQTHITSTTLTTITSITVPSGSAHLVRIWLEFWVGSGNTNAGTISVLTNYTDPIAGSDTLHLITFNGSATPVTLANASIAAGNDCRTIPLEFQVTSGSTVNIQYQNSAAGTISDHVTASIETVA